MKSIEDTEDILQDVWYQFSNLGNIEEIQNISGWLFQVSKNKITDLYRKRKTANLEDLTYENELGESTIKDILLIDDSNDPELAYFKELFWDELFEALEELPDQQKLVYIQNELDGKTLQAIADEQNTSLKTIISRKRYAVKHLKDRLEPLYNEMIN